MFMKNKRKPTSEETKLKISLANGKNKNTHI